MTQDRREMFVDGKFRPVSTSDHISIIDPATEVTIGSIADSNEADVSRAVAAAQTALPGWKETSPQERAAYLRALADCYAERAEDMAALVTHQNGAVIKRSRRTNGTRPVAIYRYNAQLADTFEPESVLSPDDPSLVRREPLGVVGAIVPWNAPQSLLASKLGPALAAGCTVVVKPSPETSLDTFMLAEMLNEIGLPPGVVNVVTGGREAGTALVRHPGIDKVSFTGSTAAGRVIAATCGEMLKHVTAELGGKSAAVVLDDADLDVFAANLISTCLPNTGQVCYSCTRILAPRSRFAEVVDLVVETLGNAVIGDPKDPTSDFGPLVSEVQRQRVESYIQSAIAAGARSALGGGRPMGLPNGYYVEPTVLVDIRREMRVFREEIFGPVLVVVPFDDDADAVRMANDSSYGLGGSVFSKDISRATAVARQMETGSIAINGHDRSDAAPAHGYKDSGVGGDPGLAGYLQLKSISRPRS
ncbi:aldehyde dehydrogenase [Blastococcus capsensis]|uniref:aldehyde dehydrogenase n=1 Tax=Blastococcus capsensis TaxID=1564163 RepID=UPI0025416C4B|nr:aldehyde dehydrogenase [Blastococcus capsensis]MDK3255434.1 aldehyde dehydrogenase [Blastococcus capsensis]